ncbi:MAG: 2-amino-4-hydroxy-6-hydroxymethyldihydropteridine diphosphokinase [Gammaproteobacteria bacterium]|nr:2-amino-4-hydroxy-6-hydroxymethyldihydropteridine diphosphokinase [Gammaproteobacteria bacterium]MDH5628786.1 2-amino-4-hydroxy-6-hydroxymethyldihydropteridine diphosphokinase [Gammaproteobacteria bacterium]
MTIQNNTTYNASDDSTKKEATAFIGLGSNLDEPVNQINLAIESLQHLETINVISVSSLYRSRPLGGFAQPDYINAVAKIYTSLSPVFLLDELQLIEIRHGRVRNSERWSPRTLDLDLLLYNNETIESERLCVPHYGLYHRNFVLMPLHEISPDLILPDGLGISTLVKNINKDGITKL